MSNSAGWRVSKRQTNQQQATVVVSPCDFCLQAKAWLQGGAQNNQIHKKVIFSTLAWTKENQL